MEPCHENEDLEVPEVLELDLTELNPFEIAYHELEEGCHS